MAIAHDEPEGSGPPAVIVSVIVLLALIAVLFYGLAALHWFGFDSPASIGTAPSVTPSPSASATAAASASASP